MHDEMMKVFEDKEPLVLTENPLSTWEEAHEKCPQLTKGWYELTHLTPTVRLEFLRDYWANALPPDFPQFYPFLDRFFATIREITITGTKEKVFMVYYLKEQEFPFMGGPPLNDLKIKEIQEGIAFPLPQDFLNFFRIHDGFFRMGEGGILSHKMLIEETKNFYSKDLTFKWKEKEVSSHSLFPFYCLSDCDIYQCFHQGWTPGDAVGNVFCSMKEKTISDFCLNDRGKMTLAFPSFTEWLMFYLEDFRSS